MLESRGPRLALDRRAAGVFVVLVAAAVWLTTNLPWQLEDYDQAKQAFTSLEMVQQGHWFYQHTPNAWVATKPPLVGWISAAVFSITRSWDFAWRFPSIAAALALAWLVYRVSRNAYGTSAGVLALAALSLNLFAPRLATLARTDMPLALVIFLIGAQIFVKVRAESPWNSRDRWTAFALLTAAMLIKGPIVYAFLLPGIVAHRFWVCPGDGSKVSAWCGPWPWLGSLLVFAIWVTVGIHTVPDFLEHVVIREFGGRFEGTHRAQPFYFYLPHLLHRFAPWSILLIGFGVYLRRHNRNFRSSDTAWLLCWSFGGLLVMSLIPSKRIDRIFPVIPPLALLLAAWFTQMQARDNLRLRALRWSEFAVLASSIFTLGYTISKVVPALREHRAAFADFSRGVRQQTTPSHLRFDVLGGEDEGMLPYLRKMEFAELPDAIAHWRAHTIDAAVLPEEELADFRRAVSDINPEQTRWSGPAGNHHRRYVFLTRR